MILQYTCPKVKKFQFMISETKTIVCNAFNIARQKKTQNKQTN